MKVVACFLNIDDAWDLASVLSLSDKNGKYDVKKSDVGFIVRDLSYSSVMEDGGMQNDGWFICQNCGHDGLGWNGEWCNWCQCLSLLPKGNEHGNARTSDENGESQAGDFGYPSDAIVR